MVEACAAAASGATAAAGRRAVVGDPQQLPVVGDDSPSEPSLFALMVGLEVSRALPQPLREVVRPEHGVLWRFSRGRRRSHGSREARRCARPCGSS
jgi:hypothetical protein